jgi:hypothetical protein
MIYPFLSRALYIIHIIYLCSILRTGFMCSCLLISSFLIRIILIKPFTDVKYLNSVARIHFRVAILYAKCHNIIHFRLRISSCLIFYRSFKSATHVFKFIKFIIYVFSFIYMLSSILNNQNVHLF